MRFKIYLCVEWCWWMFSFIWRIQLLLPNYLSPTISPATFIRNHLHLKMDLWQSFLGPQTLTSLTFTAQDIWTTMSFSHQLAMKM